MLPVYIGIAHCVGALISGQPSVSRLSDLNMADRILTSKLATSQQLFQLC